MTKRPKQVSGSAWKHMSFGAREVAYSYWLVQTALEKKYGKEQAAAMGMALGADGIAQLLAEQRLSTKDDE